MRGLAKTTLRQVARTPLGRRALRLAILDDPAWTVETLGPAVNRAPGFDRVASWPESLSGFEQLAFLFSSNPLNHGIALLRFDEAAYLYRLVRSLGAATIVEIGRFKGGSSFVIAAAMDEGAELWSYDLHVKLTSEFRGTELDAALGRALARYRLAERVHLVVADSRSAEPPPRPVDLVFVDGDHSYEGARADYLAWRERVRPGGHLLFHDGAFPGDLSGAHAEVVRLVAEIERDDDAFVRRGGAGTVVHFERTGAGGADGR